MAEVLRKFDLLKKEKKKKEKNIYVIRLHKNGLLIKKQTKLRLIVITKNLN